MARYKKNKFLALHVMLPAYESVTDLFKVQLFIKNFQQLLLLKFIYVYQHIGNDLYSELCLVLQLWFN